MMNEKQVTINSGVHSLALPHSDLQLLYEALHITIYDSEKLAASRIPEQFLAGLPLTLGEIYWSDETGEVRAGDWILVVDQDGLLWQNRLMPPSPPQIGIMLEGRLERSEDRWTVPGLVFKRIR